MDETLTLRHERVDDLPLILGMAQRIGLVAVLDRHLGRHGLQRGLSNGQLAVGWLAYILSQGDHRKSAVREWANGLAQTLGQLLGEPIRAVEFSDDRLGGVLRRLAGDAAWAAIERELWAATVAVYDLGLGGVRLDSTTSYGFHQAGEGGLMRLGYSKDHRPDLPQLKLMAAAAEPSGHLIASDVVSGEQGDSVLYTPLIRRVRGILGRNGVLYAGDSKMAALATRAELAAAGDFYLMPLPRSGESAATVEAWLSAAVDGEQMAAFVWDGPDLLGAGYELTRPLTAPVDGRWVGWTERVLVVRSAAYARSQAAGFDQRLAAAAAALTALTPEPGRGKRPLRSADALRAAITAVEDRYGVAGLFTVGWECRQTATTRYVGRGRGGPGRPTATTLSAYYRVTAVQPDEAAIAARRYRLGWRIYLTNTQTAQLSLTRAVVHYRGGWSPERDFHLLKDLPLGLSPLFVWKDDQIAGLTRLLTLALRLLTLLESRVRQALQQAQTKVAGLYEGQPARTTDRPSGKRVLSAFARAEITLTRVELGPVAYWHLSPLLPLHRQLLDYLSLPLSLYDQLAETVRPPPNLPSENYANPPSNLRET
jgi:transposase